MSAEKTEFDIIHISRSLDSVYSNLVNALNVGMRVLIKIEKVLYSKQKRTTCIVIFLDC